METWFQVPKVVTVKECHPPVSSLPGEGTVILIDEHFLLLPCPRFLDLSGSLWASLPVVPHTPHPPHLPLCNQSNQSKMQSWS